MSADGFVAELTFVAILIVLNGLFAGAEIAVVSARRSVLHARAQAGDRNAAAVLRLKADPDRFLATVQIGVTLVGTMASAIGGVAAIERLEPLLASVPLPWLRDLAEPLAVATVVFTIAYLSLVVGELVPKSVALRYAETIAMRVARPVEFLGRVSGPVLAVLAASTRLVLRPLGLHRGPPSPFHTLDDLKAIVREAEDQGLVQGELLSGALTFHDRDVRQILTPRNRIDFIALGMSVEQAMDRVAESGHSRYPVYDGNPENVIGFLYAHDLFAAAQSGQGSDLKTLVRPALIMPAGKPATALLAEMRTSRSQMALIVDEHGSLVGLVTLEDLLEVIVGEIQDEHKVREERMVHLPGGAMEIDGAFPVHELNTDHDLGLPESTRYVTIAGLLLQRLGTLPKADDTLSLSPYTITVIRMQRQRIARVRIQRGPQTERNAP